MVLMHGNGLQTCTSLHVALRTLLKWDFWCRIVNKAGRSRIQTARCVAQLPLHCVENKILFSEICGSLKIIIWDVTPCDLVERYSNLEKLASSIFKVEKSVKIGSFTLDYIVSHPRRMQCSNVIVWEVQRKEGSKTKLNSIIWVHERTIPTEGPPLVGEVIANFCG
jgi:hypothetical protein